MLSKKIINYPKSPSGIPGVQTLLPIMLNYINLRYFSLQNFVSISSFNPAKIFHILNKGQIRIGFDADFTIVDLKKSKIIKDNWIISKCKWTPYHNKAVIGWPIGTIIRGNIVMWEGDINNKLIGKPINFY